MQFGFFQAKHLNPKVDGKQQGSHHRILFREQHEKYGTFNTTQVFLSEDQMDDVVIQAIKIAVDDNREEFLDKVDKIINGGEQDGI